MATFHENLVQSFHNFRDKYLKANGNFFKFSYDATTKKYGFTINGTFHPFKTVQASKTVAAGTSAKTVTPDSGYDGVASVTVNPTPSQTESVTAGTSAITVSPDSGKLLSKVTVNPTPSQTKSATAGTSAKTVSPDSGKLLSSVTVDPTPSQSKSASPSTSAQTITPDSGKLLSSVSISAISPQRAAGTAATITGIDGTGPYVYFPYGWWPNTSPDHGCFTRLTQAQAQAAHQHTGTRATVTSNGTIDLGATHNIRYVPVNVSGSGVVPISLSVNHTINSNANTVTAKWLDLSTKTFKTVSTTVYGSTSQHGKGSWSVTLGGIAWAITISEIAVGSGYMVRLSVTSSATSVAPASSGYADYNVPNSSYAYAMTAYVV